MQRKLNAELIQMILTQKEEEAHRHAEAVAAQKAAQEAQRDQMMLTFERMISQTLGRKQGLAGGEGPLGQVDEPQGREEARLAAAETTLKTPITQMPPSFPTKPNATFPNNPLNVGKTPAREGSNG